MVERLADEVNWMDAEARGYVYLSFTKSTRSMFRSGSSVTGKYMKLDSVYTTPVSPYPY